MDIKQFSDRAIVALESPISDNIKKKMGKFDYLPSPIVFKQMNDLFTPSGWSTEVISVEVVDKITYKNGNKDMIKVVAMATVRVSILGYNSHTDVATFTGTSHIGDIGGAYDTALKGAVSVAHTRACRKLGKLFGLGLYRDAQQSTPLHESFINANNHPDDMPSSKQVELIGKDEVKSTILDGEDLSESEYSNRVSMIMSYLGIKNKVEILKFSKADIGLAVQAVIGGNDVNA